MSRIDYPATPGLPVVPTYSQVAVASGARTVYVSGQVSTDAEGTLVGANDLAAQVTQAMKNLGTALAAAGAGFNDVVRMTTYVVDYRPEMRSVLRDARQPFMAGRASPPASTLIGVSALAVPGWLVEIEAVAVID